MPTAPSESQVREYLKTLSNWGRWGSSDDLGTINLITPAKRLAAARLVRDGVSVTCARPIATDIAADTTFQPVRFMVASGEGRDTASAERQIQRRGASEFDNANLEDLARACAERGRWEFLLTIAPLRLKNVTGSPVNPIALF